MTGSFSDAFDAISSALGGGESLLLLSTNLIDEDPDNPRTRFEDGELAALADTIRRKGLLQPITVQAQGVDGRYRLRFGARRLRAARLAGLSEVRALVQTEAIDAAEALVEQIIENDQREGLSTLELANAVARLLSLKVKKAEIGRRLGRPKEQIAMLSAVREMAPELQALAPHLGVRTLYELYAAWRADPKRAQAWLSQRDPRTITQAAAREFARGAEAPRRTDRQAADGAVLPAVRVSQDTREPDRPPVAAETDAGPRQVRIEVQAGDARGVLLMDRVSRATERARVRLEDGRIVTAGLAELRILRLRPG